MESGLFASCTCMYGAIFPSCVNASGFDNSLRCIILWYHFVPNLIAIIVLCGLGVHRLRPQASKAAQPDLRPLVALCHSLSTGSDSKSPHFVFRNIFAPVLGLGFNDKAMLTFQMLHCCCLSLHRPSPTLIN